MLRDGLNTIRFYNLTESGNIFLYNLIYILQLRYTEVRRNSPHLGHLLHQIFRVTNSEELCRSRLITIRLHITNHAIIIMIRMMHTCCLYAIYDN